MRRSTVPPRSLPAAATRAPEPPQPPQRKVFNCIVDDTALVAGVKKSTRDGIRKWLAQGAIRLFVPLHTLGQLHRLKNGAERINADAREAIKWLDDVTSAPAEESAVNVQIEGVEEAFPTWAEAEKYLLPETLLSMEESESEDDDYHEDLESSFNALDVSDETSVSSTHSLEDTPKTPDMRTSLPAADSKSTNGLAHTEHPSALILDSPHRSTRSITPLGLPQKSPKSAVPAYLQSLFNHILWRINADSNPSAALDSFILLTDDPAKQLVAQKFGIRAKRLEQLRDAVAREDREYKNHLMIYKMETEAKGILAAATLKPAERPKSSHLPETKMDLPSDDEDVVLFQRAPRGPAATTNGQRIIDPNDFGRSAAPPQQPSRSIGRGAHTHIPPRGRGASPFRGRGTFVPRGGAYVPPSAAFHAPQQQSPSAPAANRIDLKQPIDPNSFARPAPRAGMARGGMGRRLWEPN